MNASEQRQLLADVEAFCEEIRPIEELCYVEHRFNDQVIPLARKHNLLGMPVPAALGGRGADTRHLRPGPGPHRPGRHRRPHLLLRPHLHRPVPDPDLGQRRAETPLPAAIRARREDPGLRPDRAGGRQQPAGNADDLRAPRRPLRPQRRQVPDLQRRHRQRHRHLRLSQGHGRPDQRLHRGYGRPGLRQRGPDGQDGHADRQHGHVRADRLSRCRPATCWARRATASASPWARWSAAGSAWPPAAWA